jgi:hypothetical protein
MVGALQAKNGYCCRPGPVMTNDLLLNPRLVDEFGQDTR